MPSSRLLKTKGARLSRGWARKVGQAVLPLALFVGIHSHAQSTTRIRIDASHPFADPAPARYDGGTATSPSGSVIGVNSRYLTLDGKPWLPVMGEFHFSRYPRSQWEEEVLKMKAGGVNIVATYVIWIHHEEIEGSSTGRRSAICAHLRSFAAGMACTC